jgi:hypothetical protein
MSNIQIPDRELNLSEKLRFYLTQLQASYKPKEPRMPKNNHPESFLAYAEALERYQANLETWETYKAEAEAHNTLIYSICEGLVREDSGLDTLKVSDKQKEKIWRKAWEQGHSNGYYEVYQELVDLVELFTEED